MEPFRPEIFYGNIADKYHWFFSSWDKIMDRQAKQISSILEKYNVKTILDCSCGTGLQAIGLARHGYFVDGGDISQNMIEQARKNAKEAGVNVNFKQADFRELKRNFTQEYDAVISWGNSIPHLMNNDDIAKALKNIYACIKTGGIALFDMRNYDVMLTDLKRFLPMRINDLKDNVRYSIVYVFDYSDNLIRFNILYLIEDLATGEKRMETESVDYNPIQKQQFINMLAQTGFRNIIVEEDITDIHYFAEK